MTPTHYPAYAGRRYTPTQRAADQYHAAHQPGHGSVFEPITLAEATTIVEERIGDLDAVRAQRAAVEGWLASLGDKVTDEAVFEDAENNDAITCALAIEWAVGQYREQGRQCFDYICEMVERLSSRRGLSAGQIRGLLNCWRAEVQREAKALAAEVADVKPFTDDDLDITPVQPEFKPVVEFLHRLAENGLKRPVVRIVTIPQCGVSDDEADFASAALFAIRHDLCGHEPVVLKVAGANSSQRGAIGVSDGGAFGVGTFYGWVKTDGNANPPLSQRANIIEALRAFVANPETALVRYGRVLGNCGICGRVLSDPVSIARGIGPICAGKGGF